MLRQENAVHATSALKVYYQVGEMGWSNNMQLELLAQIVKQPCFDTLRTKEQLGEWTEVANNDGEEESVTLCMLRHLAMEPMNSPPPPQKKKKPQKKPIMVRQWIRHNVPAYRNNRKK